MEKFGWQKWNSTQAKTISKKYLEKAPMAVLFGTQLKYMQDRLILPKLIISVCAYKEL